MPARLGYDPQLLEEVVQLEVRRREGQGDFALGEAYHRQADPLYRLDPGRREREFVALHGRLFRDLGFAARVAKILEGYRAALTRIESLTFVRALRPEEEGADLGAPTPGAKAADGRAAVVRMRAPLFLSSEQLESFLDHELTHLGDLLSPGFSHDPGSLDRVPPHRRRLVQDRYRALWAASVDGRLSRHGKRPVAGRGEHREELRRFFPALSDLELDGLLDPLLNDERPTHAGLLAVAVGRGPREPHQPGAPCPLCGFPTHHWVDPRDGALIRMIRQDVPRWHPDEGCCDRCFEMYELRSLTQA